MDFKSIFSHIYARDIWDGGSGPGSDPANVAAYLEWLHTFLRERNIKSIVDCGCGDWQLMRHTDLTGIDYLGIDIVPGVIERNREQFGRPGVRFECTDFVDAPLPHADLLICKDVLQHLPDAKVKRFLARLPNYEYSLLTNDLGPNTSRDTTLRHGEWHFAPITIQHAPFNVMGDEVVRTMDIKSTLLVTREQAQARAVAMPAADDDALPFVLVAILAKQKEPVLPLYLRCLEALDYPKHRIKLWVRTNNNTDRTADILREWLQRVGHEYAHVHFDDSDVPQRVQDFGVHEWNATRFSVLGRMRQESMECAPRWGCKFYFVADCDNFLRPKTLRALVALDLQISSPLLHHETPGRMYSNFHYRTDDNGYFLMTQEYELAWAQTMRGLLIVDVVHCTYLVRSDAIAQLRYEDGSGRHEYVVFSDSARRAGIDQYFDNREIYGWLSLDETAELSEGYLQAELLQAEAAKN